MQSTGGDGTCAISGDNVTIAGPSMGIDGAVTGVLVGRFVTCGMFTGIVGLVVISFIIVGSSTGIGGTIGEFV